MSEHNEAVLSFASPNTKKAENHFADGLNMYKMFWIVAIGSVLGFAVETAYCFYQRGQFESRANLVYGPINLIYGLGALSLYLSLHKINKKNHVLILIVGATVGTVIEFVCSWAQEMVFGTVSWDYSNAAFNIGGRVCLRYSVFWGILALLWVHLLLPLLNKMISKIPDSFGRPLTWILFAFLILDAVISITVVTRWMSRTQGIPADNAVIAYIDTAFPDSRMENIYSNMETVK